MLNTTNQSINLPGTLIEKCFGQNFVHVELSQIIFMKNSQPNHFVSKTNPHENKMICPLKTWS
jgi:hypothetical protein